MLVKSNKGFRFPQQGTSTGHGWPNFWADLVLMVKTRVVNLGWAPEVPWCLTLPWAEEEEGWGLHPTAQSFLALLRAVTHRH